MEETIKAGTILIAEGAPLPESLRLESEPYSDGWRVLKHADGDGLGRAIGTAGWNFFYMAGARTASAFGAHEEKTTRKAIRQVIADARSKHFNCLEITRVTAKRFLGLPYMSVSAHSRHIQESLILFGG